MRTRVVVTIFLVVSAVGLGRAQSPAPALAPTSSPAAVSLAAQALRVIAGPTPLVDVTIQANATYIAGSDEETGTATLVARGNSQGSVTLSLSGGQRLEIRNGANGDWTGADGIEHLMALHNCWVDADWFFPALTLQALQADPTLIVTSLGPTVILAQPDDPAGTLPGVAVVHLQFSHLVPGQTADVTATIQTLSAVDLYLDPKSLLPVALVFNTHPQDDLVRSSPVELRFGDYRAEGGVMVPFHIQKFLQNTLTLDLAITNVAVNTGISPTAFVTPQSLAGGAQ